MEDEIVTELTAKLVLQRQTTIAQENIIVSQNIFTDTIEK